VRESIVKAVIVINLQARSGILEFKGDAIGTKAKSAISRSISLLGNPIRNFLLKFLQAESSFVNSLGKLT